MKLERCTKRSLQYHFFLVKDVLCKTFPQSWEACRSYGAANVQQLRGPVGASGDGGWDYAVFFEVESFGWVVWMVRRWSQKNAGFSGRWMATSLIKFYCEQCEVCKITGITVGCLSFHCPRPRNSLRKFIFHHRQQWHVMMEWSTFVFRV